MEPEQLEAAARKENIPVPKGLEEGILSAIAAKEAAKEAVREKARARRFQWAPYAAVAAAAMVTVAVVIPRSEEPRLRDSFDDPYLAYAEVEATFQRISDKMTRGVDLASKAGETAETPIQIIKNISE